MTVELFLRHAMGMATLSLALGSGAVAAQEAPPAPGVIAPDTPEPIATGNQIDSTAAGVVSASPMTLAAGSLIEIRIDEAVNSKTHKTGDWYAISLSQPVMSGEVVLIPAGTTGRGQVVHSAKSGWGGKAGELILAARYLEYHGRQVALRGMKLGGVGGNNEGLAFAATVAGGLVAMPLVFALNGKNADIAAGTLATAKLSADMDAASLAAVPAAAAASTDPAVAGPQPDQPPAAAPVTGEEKQIQQEGV